MASGAGGRLLRLLCGRIVLHSRRKLTKDLICQSNQSRVFIFRKHRIGYLL